jgi:PRC-barrel domain protein
MALATVLEFGGPIRGADEVVGSISDVVVDPAARRVTHLIVRHEPDEIERLVPVELVEAEEPGGRLAVAPERLAECKAVREFAYLQAGEFPAPDADSDIGVEDAVPVGELAGSPFDGYGGGYSSNTAISYDRVPKGEIELRRSSDVEAVDGHRLGHLRAVRVDEHWQITQVVLEHGHLWGTRDVAVPVVAVETLETDLVRLTIDKHALAALPSTKP